VKTTKDGNQIVLLLNSRNKKLNGVCSALRDNFYTGIGMASEKHAVQREI
jgi:hypothetical protein